MTSKPAIIAETDTVIQQALNLKITTPKHAIIATTLLSTINKQLDRIIEEKEKITKPLLTALSNERSRWKPAELALTSAVQSLKSQLSAFQTSQTNREKAEKQAIIDKIGKNDSINDTRNALSTIKHTADTLKTDAGTVKFRTTYRISIDKLEHIPRGYYDLNESRVLLDLKSGKEVAGCHLEEIQTPVNYR